MAILALVVLGPWHVAAACSISSARGVRWPGESHLIAIPTARMVSAARGLPPDLARLGPGRSYHDRIRALDDWSWWRGRFRAWWGRMRDAFRPDLPYGQVVRLERVGGSDSVQVLAALAQSAGEAVLVDWQLTASCMTALSERRQPWLVPGERVFMAAALRDRAGWVDGRPTFDVSASDYAYSGRPRWYPDGSLAEPGLSLDEYWRLYEALPALPDLARDSAAALAPLRAWTRSQRELAGHPVVRRELHLTARYAESAGRYSPTRR